MVISPSWSANNPLATYLPQIQLRSIVARTARQTEPFERNCAGSILLVDITGFTELAEQFAAQGAAAVEGLSKVLNAYFGRMAEVITEHGGDILTFAGDAALALWPAENDEELAQSACRAVQAAQAVQVELLGYKLPQGIILRQRAAVGAGPLSIMQVGGTDGRWQFLVAGDARRQPRRQLGRCPAIGGGMEARAIALRGRLSAVRPRQAAQCATTCASRFSRIRARSGICFRTAALRSSSCG
jgi:hypothetical protein